MAATRLTGPPTQTRHPWRATTRTTAAAIIGLLPILPSIINAFGVSSVPWVAGTLAGIAAVTRVLAMPAVEVWMKAYAPWLAAAPKREEVLPGNGKVPVTTTITSGE
jgi:hypothetical protein